MKSLVIVESPAKAKTINKILGDSCQVMASGGHIRDLPKKEIGIDIKNEFKPKYVAITKKKDIISKLKKAAVESEKVYLAPDPDREGEAIAWHLSQIMKIPSEKMRRVTFNEITKSAVKKAFESAHDINMNKVNSQQARRILDRIVGYKISPLLWRKLKGSQSAGRVQSVALRLVCEKEKQIEDFNSVKYWDIFAELSKIDNKQNFQAKLLTVDGKKVVQTPKNEDEIAIHDEKGASKIKEELESSKFLITGISKKNIKRNPGPPFTTSLLQQAGVNVLGWNIKRVMDVAQTLYEGLEVPEEGHIGLITYMRTDSVRVSEEALEEARKYIGEKFEKSYLPAAPRLFKTKKASQDAHEAIRPTSVYRTPERLKENLTQDQYKLYKIIWERFVASQMSASEMALTTVDITAGIYIFRASGNQVIFPGFRKVCPVADRKKESSLEENGLKQNGKEDNLLPDLSENEELRLLDIETKSMETKPPARYSEATLVKTLEEKSIGRPSTYVPTIQTIIKRNYVLREKSRLSPTELGKMVNEMLIKSFPDIINYDFTAKMEEELDAVEDGTEEWVKVLKDFYVPFEKALKTASDKMSEVKREVTKTDMLCPKCKEKGIEAYLVKRFGRNGEFLGCEKFSAKEPDKSCTYTEQINVKEQQPLPELKEEILCDKCEKPMVVKSGRYGHFLACSGFPGCKNTKPLPTGKKCPACGGNVVQKRYRGRMFYGCDSYPDCKFTAKNLDEIK